MMLDVAIPLVTFDGDTIHDTQGGPVTTLKTICVKVLMEHDPRQGSLDGLAKYKRYKLAERISEADGAVDIDATEIATIKDLVGAIYPPSIVGVVYDLLEGGAIPKPTALPPLHRGPAKL